MGTHKGNCEYKKQIFVKSKHVFFLCAIVSMGLLSACGSSQSDHTYRRLPAPNSESQVGYLVDLEAQKMSDSQQEVWLSDMEARGAVVREISRAHGLYELYNIPRVVIEQIGGVTKVERNKITYLKSVKRDYTDFRFDSQEPSDDQDKPKLVLCEQVENLPPTSIQSTNGAPVSEKGPVILKRSGASLSFGMSFTTNYEFPYRMAIIAPNESKFNKMVAPANTPIEFTPDDLGTYAILVDLKLNDNLYCRKVVVFGLTDNVPYLGPSLFSSNQKVSDFKHIPMIHVPQVWSLTQGQGIKVAIVDSGVNYNHPDIATNIAINRLESPNGRDDDGNKFVDDQYGWDFASNDPYPYDDNSHGTHVAGLTGSSVGVAPKAYILPIKVTTALGSADNGSVAAGVYYAVDSGAKVINLSLGGAGSTAILQRALLYAQARNVLVVAAAGNENTDIDLKPSFPAAYPLSNILSVAASDLSGNIATYSNVGAVSVDIVAPGGDQYPTPELGGLRSLYYENSAKKPYVSYMGTSMATPVVSGVAALLYALQPNLTPVQIKTIIMSSGIASAKYQGKVASGRMIDAALAVKSMQALGALRPAPSL